MSVETATSGVHHGGLSEGWGVLEGHSPSKVVSPGPGGAMYITTTTPRREFLGACAPFRGTM